MAVAAPALAQGARHRRLTGLATRVLRAVAGLRARILFCIGADDPMIPLEQQAGGAKMRAVPGNAGPGTRRLIGRRPGRTTRTRPVG